MKIKKFSFALICLLASFELLPESQAVVPPPDGGYPNFTTAEGTQTLQNLTTGAGNTGLGWRSLFLDSTGSFNTGVGAGTLVLNNADSNTAVGATALLLNSTGTENTATGTGALLNNTTGNHNTANGVDALFDGSGNDNTAVGFEAGLYATGSNNVYIGSGEFGIGGESNACYIASIFGQTSVTGVPVLINFEHKLGTATSSKRFEDEIKPIDKVSETIFALKPVTFRYKKTLDPQGTPQFGLVAEDVQNVNPALVVRDEEGEPYSVRYDQVNAMLLNEFLKEHQTVEALKKQVAALTAGLQKVSAQLELNKAAPRTALNNR